MDVEKDEVVPYLSYRFKLLKPQELLIVSSDDSGLYNVLKDDKGTTILTQLSLEKSMKEKKLDYEICVLNALCPKDLASWKNGKSRERNLVLLIFDYLFCALTRASEPANGKLNSFVLHLMEEIERYPYRLFLVYNPSTIEQIGEKLYLNGQTSEFRKKFEAVISYLKGGHSELLVQNERKLLRFLRRRIVWIEQDELLSFIVAEKTFQELTVAEMFKLSLYDKWLKLFEQINNCEYGIEVITETREAEQSNDDIDYLIAGHTDWLEATIFQCCYLHKGEEVSVDKIKSYLDALKKNGLVQKISAKRGFLSYTNFENFLKQEILMAFPGNPSSLQDDIRGRVSAKIKSIKRYVQNLLPDVLGSYYTSNDKDAKVALTNKKIISRQRLTESKESQSQLQNENSEVRYAYYSRHETAAPPDACYFETLTGAKLSFMQFAYPPSTKYLELKFICQLFENAYPVVMVIDERIQKFVKDKKLEERFRDLNIVIPFKIEYIGGSLFGDDPIEASPEMEFVEINLEMSKVKIMFRQPSRTLRNGAKNSPYRVTTLVIHHTLVEKFCSQKEEDMGKMMVELKHEIPSIIVTSGRGKPESITPYAKYIAFSNIESCLMQQYPDRLLLCQAILKTLN